MPDTTKKQRSRANLRRGVRRLLHVYFCRQLHSLHRRHVWQLHSAGHALQHLRAALQQLLRAAGGRRRRRRAKWLACSMHRSALPALGCSPMPSWLQRLVQVVQARCSAGCGASVVPGGARRHCTMRR